jgi:hypothetical protein
MEGEVGGARWEVEAFASRRYCIHNQTRKLF